MNDYLNYKFDFNNYKSVSALDELALWSAPFSVLLLDSVKYQPVENILDIGCGTGIISTELAQRFGNKTTIHALDPWGEALKKIEEKKENLKLDNIKIVEGIAEEIPYNDNFFDIIVSNNGMNNVQNDKKAISECYRTLKQDGQMVFTFNTQGTFKAFYNVFIDVLKNRKMMTEVKIVRAHIREKRKPIREILTQYRKAGFKIKSIKKDTFSFKFSNAGAFFNHHLIKSFFLDKWTSIISPDNVKSIFKELETELDNYPLDGVLNMKVPFDCVIVSK